MDRHKNQRQIYGGIIMGAVMYTIMASGAARTETIRMPASVVGNMGVEAFAFDVYTTHHGNEVVIVHMGVGLDNGPAPYQALAEAVKRYPSARRFTVTWVAGQPGPVGESGCRVVYNRVQKIIRCYGTKITYDESNTWNSKQDYLYGNVYDNAILQLSQMYRAADDQNAGDLLERCHAKHLQTNMIEDRIQGKIHTVKRRHYP